MTRSNTLIRWTIAALIAVIIGLVTAGAFRFHGYLVPILPSAASVQDSLRSLSVPPGFTIEVFAADVPGARSLALSPSGTVFVGTRQEGKVYAVLDLDKDMVAERVITLASGLRMPNGVAFRNGNLYVAEVSRVLRFSDVEENLSGRQEPTVITAAYPGDEHHGWKFIAFGPDGLLYVPVGAPCNVCMTDEETYALITRLDPDTGERQVFVTGVRNTVGFDWQPETGVLVLITPEDGVRCPNARLRTTVQHGCRKIVGSLSIVRDHLAEHHVAALPRLP